jgi:signal transduction histidine kinase
MKLFTNQEIKRFFCAVAVVLAAFLILSQGIALSVYGAFSLPLLALSLLTAGGILAVCFRYFTEQERVMEDAVTQMEAYLDGDTQARIACDREGELYRLFHTVNTLTTVLNAHADNEGRQKEFLKNTISDISHQLKTPLAALNIYNGLLQGEAEELPEIKEFADLSEQELDRIEGLVQNLLKITKLDAGAVVIEPHTENVSDMIHDVALHFAYRAKQERKEIVLSGSDAISLCCDRNWILEAIDNIVKNALDHTEQGDTIWVEWKQFASVVQITVKDNGSGIHPEDLHHIFKRFYRSRFSKDTQGVGLGLPLAKAIVEAHDGTIEVDSELGRGTTFILNFLIPTKL